VGLVVPIPVVAKRDLFRYKTPLIKAGTRGNIVGITGGSTYAVAFLPSKHSLVVTLGYLTDTDVQEV